MSSSPAKRRKTSPTTALPVDAPTTPSRIPVRTTGAVTPRSRRPSFASPTKASIARHNPQLLARTPQQPAQPATGSRGRDLDGVFARALDRARLNIDRPDTSEDGGTSGSTTQENEAREETHVVAPSQTNPLSGPTPAAKARRNSRSPFKQSPTKAFQALVESGELDKVNPFHKTGLRRSPTVSAHDTTIPPSNPILQDSPVLKEQPNPFGNNKTLRRSPLVSEEELVLTNQHNASRKRTLRPSPVMSPETRTERDIENPFAKRGKIARSPIGSQDKPHQEKLSNPFEQRRELVRSPVPTTTHGTQENSGNVITERRSTKAPMIVSQDQAQQEIPNPFLKKGLVRSPVLSQTIVPMQHSDSQLELQNTPIGESDLQPDTVIFANQQAMTLTEIPATSIDAERALVEATKEHTTPEPEETILAPSDWRKSSPGFFETALEDPVTFSDPIFAQAIEDALRSDHDYSGSQHNLGNRISQTDMRSPDSPSLSQAVEAALLSSPLRAREPRVLSHQPEFSLLVEEALRSNIPRSEREITPSEPSRDNLDFEGLPQRHNSPPPISQRSLLRSPARRFKPVASLPDFQPTKSPAKKKSKSRVTAPEEPELPPTPTQLGIDDPIVTTPPTGIHNTPGKRSRRSRALAERIKSSPLKPRPSPRNSKDLPPKASIADIVPKARDEPVIDTTKRRRSARFSVQEDPYASKKTEIKDLMRELQQLQADVTLGKKECERIHSHYLKNKTLAPASDNEDQLLTSILRSAVVAKPPTVDSKPVSAFKSIGLFLPFSSRRKQKNSTSRSQQALASHRSVKLDDPLPYLQAFSPLIYNSNITLFTPEKDSDASITNQDWEEFPLQQHIINVAHPFGFFSARLGMVVDSKSLSIKSLDILKIDPRAEKELGGFARSRCDGGPSLCKDIGVVCWAMGRWVETSVARAKVWCTVEHDYGSANVRAKSTQPRKKRKHAALENSSTQDGEDGLPRSWTKKQLLSHIGRSTMELSTEEVELRFEWKINFDWTGEVESAISATARVPKTWQKSDDRKSLNNIPESFDRLVKAKGPLRAIRTIVGLMLPSS